MRIVDCFLDTNNSRPLDSGTLGDVIQRQGGTALWSDRGAEVDTLVVHYISAIEITPFDPFRVESILAIFPAFGVSSHYLIARDGAVLRLVPEDKKAWHCGGSIMPEPDNRTGVNDFSIGVELVATADSGFTNEQYGALAELTRCVQTIHGIQNIVGHEDVAGARAVEMQLRADAKDDPGPLFDWGRFLGAEGITFV